MGTPLTRSKVIVLKLGSYQLEPMQARKVVIRKRKRHAKTNEDADAEGYKLKRKSALAHHIAELKELKDEPQAYAVKKHEIEVLRANKEQEAYIIQKNAEKWSKVVAESELEMETVLVKLSHHTMPVPVQVPRLPDSLPAKVQANIVETHYTMQEISRKLAPPNKQQLSFKPSGFLQPLTQQALARLQAEQQAVSPTVLNQSHNIYPAGQVPILRWMPSSFQPRLVQAQSRMPLTSAGCHSLTNDAFHYAKAVQNQAVFNTSQFPRTRALDIDIKAAALRNLQQYNDQRFHLQPSNSRNRISHQAGDTSHTTLNHEPRLGQFKSCPTSAKQLESTILGSQGESFNAKISVYATLTSQILPAAQHMFERRRARARRRHDAAAACQYEVQWRESSRGRFIATEAGLGAFMKNQDMTAPRPVDQELGYSREGLWNDLRGIFELEHERPDDCRYKTVQQWREVLKTGGAYLANEERRELGLEQMNSMSEDDVAGAMSAEPCWGVDMHTESVRRKLFVTSEPPRGTYWPDRHRTPIPL